MPDLRLRYEGNGAFRVASKLDLELAERTFQPQEFVRAKASRQRSVRQNDFFHALIEAAFDNQRGGPLLPTWRHLKSWLLIQAGHCDVTTFEPSAMTPAVAKALRATFDNVDFTHDGRRIYMKVARSVRFDGPDSDEMSAIVDRVVEIIAAHIVPGVDPASLLAMAGSGNPSGTIGGVPSGRRRDRRNALDQRANGAPVAHGHRCATGEAA